MKKFTYLFLLLITCQMLMAKGIYAQPGIRISKANWNVGVVREGEILKEELLIENGGTDVLSLKVRPSCECIGISFTQKDIKPNERTSLTITYNTKGEPGKKTYYLFLDSNDPQHSHLSWMIESEVVSQNKNINKPPGPKNTKKILNKNLNDPDGVIYLFSTPLCKYCLKLKERIIPNLLKKYNLKVDLKEYPLNIPENYEKLLMWEEETGDLNNKIPVIFVGRRALGGKKEISRGLERELAAFEKHHLSLKFEDEIKDKKIAEKYESLKILPVLGAGFIDGLNPCAFGAIIFLVSYLSMIMKRNRKEIFLTGMSFAGGVYITYFFLGLGLTGILAAVKGLSIVSKLLYILIGMLTILLAVLSFKDYIALRKYSILNKNGPMPKVSLKLPKSFLMKIMDITERHAKLKYFVIFAFVTGIIISALELVCTGQIYLPTIMYMLKVAATRNKAVGYLALYSLMFIIPLLIVFSLFFWGINSEKMEKFGKKHYKTVKIFNAFIFLFFAVYMLASALK